MAFTRHNRHLASRHIRQKSLPRVRHYVVSFQTGGWEVNTARNEHQLLDPLRYFCVAVSESLTRVCVPHIYLWFFKEYDRRCASCALIRVSRPDQFGKPSSADTISNILLPLGVFIWVRKPCGPSLHGAGPTGGRAQVTPKRLTQMGLISQAWAAVLGNHTVNRGLYTSFLVVRTSQGSIYIRPPRVNRGMGQLCLCDELKGIPFAGFEEGWIHVSRLGTRVIPQVSVIFSALHLWDVFKSTVHFKEGDESSNHSWLWFAEYAMIQPVTRRDRGNQGLLRETIELFYFK